MSDALGPVLNGGARLNAVPGDIAQGGGLFVSSKALEPLDGLRYGTQALRDLVQDDPGFVHLDPIP
nr:hypothetical protein [Saccharothrix deserti]